MPIIKQSSWTRRKFLQCLAVSAGSSLLPLTRLTAPVRKHKTPIQLRVAIHERFADKEVLHRHLSDFAQAMHTHSGGEVTIQILPRCLTDGFRECLSSNSTDILLYSPTFTWSRPLATAIFGS